MGGNIAIPYGEQTVSGSAIFVSGSWRTRGFIIVCRWRGQGTSQPFAAIAKFVPLPIKPRAQLAPPCNCASL